MIVQNPKDLMVLVRGKIPITEVNIGNIHMKEGKRQISVSVSVDDEDIQCFKEMNQRNIKLFLQRMPSEEKIKLSEVLSL
jgi:N-acetylgalactosamine PTS system EIIB component